MDRVNQLFLDVSGSSSDTFIVAGGYVAGEDSWRRFDTAWGHILRDAKVTTFHATDFYSGHGEFRGSDLTGEAHRSFAARFTGAATKHTACGFAFGLHVASYNECIAPIMASVKSPHRRVKPETYCIINCLHQAAQLAFPPGGRQAAVILEEGPGIGETLGFLKTLKELGEPWTNAYLSFTAKPKAHRPLQAADLLAHEAWRRVREVVKPDGRPLRKSLEAMLRLGTINITYAGRDDLQTAVPNLVRFLLAHPEYSAGN